MWLLLHSMNNTIFRKSLLDKPFQIHFTDFDYMGYTRKLTQ